MREPPPYSNFWEDPHLSQSETPEMRAQMELLPEESPRDDSNLGNFKKIPKFEQRGGPLPHYLQTTRVLSSQTRFIFSNMLYIFEIPLLQNILCM